MPRQIYKTSVISSFVRRALTHCSSWAATHAELKRISQLITNNGYNKAEIDEVIKRRLDTFLTKHQTQEEPSTKINLYYNNTMLSSSYKSDEKAMKNIIYMNVKPTTDTDAKLNLTKYYYKTRRTANFIMKSSCLPKTISLQDVNERHLPTNTHALLVTAVASTPSILAGYTTTTLAAVQENLRPPTVQHGAILRHYQEQHGVTLNRNQMDANTIILH